MQRDSLEKRLQRVLDDFETLAGSDPLKLRAMIPPTEIWRLFVEAYRQNKNIKLESYVNLSRLRSTTQHEILNSSLARISNMPSIALPTFRKLIKFLHLSPADCESITLGDLVKFNKGWYLFELGERNYIKGLYRAFQCIFEKHDNHTLSFIHKVHQTATEGVNNTNFRLWNEYKRGGRIRTRATIGFPLNEANSSEEGIYELLTKRDSIPLFLLKSFYIDDHTPALLRGGDTDDESEEVKHEFPEFYQKILNAKNDRALARAIYECAATNNLINPMLFINYQFGDLAANLTYKANTAINNYNNEKSNALTPMQKLHAIARVTNTVEDIHIYDDANCRTVCMITPNNLLYNCGLPLSFFRDANRFDAKSHIEQVETLIEGMEDVMTLVKTHSLHNIKTSDILSLTDDANTIGATRQYFEEAVAIEVRARRRLIPTPKSDDFIANSVRMLA